MTVDGVGHSAVQHQLAGIEQRQQRVVVGTGIPVSFNVGEEVRMGAEVYHAEFLQTSTIVHERVSFRFVGHFLSQ